MTIGGFHGTVGVVNSDTSLIAVVDLYLFYAVLGCDAFEADHPCPELAGVGVDLLDVVALPDVLAF